MPLLLLLMFSVSAVVMIMGYLFLHSCPPGSETKQHTTAAHIGQAGRLAGWLVVVVILVSSLLFLRCRCCSCRRTHAACGRERGGPLHRSGNFGVSVQLRRVSDWWVRSRLFSGWRGRGRQQAGDGHLRWGRRGVSSLPQAPAGVSIPAGEGKTWARRTTAWPVRQASRVTRGGTGSSVGPFPGLVGGRRLEVGGWPLGCCRCRPPWGWGLQAGRAGRPFLWLLAAG